MDSYLTRSPARPGIDELVSSFASCPAAHLDTEFSRLAGALWNIGVLTELAPAAVPALVTALEHVHPDRQAYLAVLLGLLAGADPVAGGGDAGPPAASCAADAAAAVRQGLDLYLDLWQRCQPGHPLSLALLYLLGHFPDDRDRILGVAAGRGLGPDDLSRLDRSLQRLDPAHPVLGRVFPSPAAWALDESEQEFDRGWIDSLSPAEVAESWRKDTRTVRGHTGAKAYWAAGHQAPVVTLANPAPPPRADPPLPATPAPDGPEAALFQAHAGAFRCPHCHAPLRFRGGSVQCGTCATRYPLAGGILDLSASVPSDVDPGSDLLMKLSGVPRMGSFYEALARPAFLRVSGSNWGGLVTPADERDYLATHLRPVDGPVLDLGAGAGTWTAMLAEAVGAGRVIALDMAVPMLTALRRRLPAVPAVRANARELPFTDASLGAVNCWNALQAFPGDAAAAVAEVARCLRPGGTLTLLTFRRSPDPVYRYFQSCHHFPQHPDGLRLFDLDEIHAWLAGSGLSVRHEAYPGTFVLLTAQRAS